MVLPRFLNGYPIHFSLSFSFSFSPFSIQWLYDKLLLLLLNGRISIEFLIRVIDGSLRTPFGSFGGKLKDLTAAELGGLASKAALEDLGNKDIPIDAVIMGNVMQTDPAGAYVARHIGHRAGLPVHVPALTVNRL